MSLHFTLPNITNTQREAESSHGRDCPEHVLLDLPTLLSFCLLDVLLETVRSSETLVNYQIIGYQIPKDGSFQKKDLKIKIFNGTPLPLIGVISYIEKKRR
jgi:hypothetical protein